MAHSGTSVHEDESLIHSAVRLGGHHALRLRDLGAVTGSVPDLHDTDGMPVPSRRKAKGK